MAIQIGQFYRGEYGCVTGWFVAYWGVPITISNAAMHNPQSSRPGAPTSAAPQPVVSQPVVSLFADIGGTNARFTLLGPNGSELASAALNCVEYPSLDSAVVAFLAKHAPGAHPTEAVLAVAAPVCGDQITLTNRDWCFSVSKTRNALGLERLEVVNDFAAQAMALPSLTPDDWAAAGGGDAEPGAPMAVLGPGSGLGVAGLVPSPGGRWVVVSGEGGHATIAPANDREADVLSLLRRRIGHVSAERVISGPGLVNLYQSLCELEGRHAATFSPSDITTAAQSGGNSLCVEATAMFFSFLGIAAGNLALTLGARGGVYIAGGIVPQLLDLIDHSPFRARFEEKGRFSTWLSRIPTRVILHPRPAFLGLRAYLLGENFAGGEK